MMLFLVIIRGQLPIVINLSLYELLSYLYRYLFNWFRLVPDWFYNNDLLFNYNQEKNDTLWQFRVETPSSQHTFSLNFSLTQSIFLVIISPDQFMHISIILIQYLITSILGLNDRQ